MRGLAPWETTRLETQNGPSIAITAMPARHGSEDVKDATGYVSGWMLEWEGQRRGTLYISGDAVFFEELEAIARRYRDRVELALLHFGAARVQRFGQEPLTLAGIEGLRLA